LFIRYWPNSFILSVQLVNSLKGVSSRMLWQERPEEAALTF